jgi:predicted helicase
LTAGNSTEHTHRTALKTLLESLNPGITATNEPRRIECGAPDFIVSKGSVTIGYIEAKDVGKSLDDVEKSEQLKRYREALSSLILTNYLEFHWFVNGEVWLKARLWNPTREGKIKKDEDGIQAAAELLTAFLEHVSKKAGTPKELAERMAKQAHLVRNLIINTFQSESESGSLHTQLTAFRNNLIPDLSPEDFADMYAQTIAYGLFAARCTTNNGAAFTRLDAAQNLPKTNPFLRKLFQYIAGYDLDDRIAWLVDDLAQVLAQADMEAVLKDFGKRIGKEDPVVHFYETFLTAYDEKVRKMRGVYYTPEPVVSYIVRSIDHILKTRFNKPEGLADKDTYILDPAVGTATFLYSVINNIYHSFVFKGQQGAWDEYVARHLLPRIFGFELLMAPYAVAHLKLGLQLQSTGYKFQSDQRLGIYLTNTLDEAVKQSEALFARWISEEANAAARVKNDEPIMVVLGNPPYSGHSANKGKWAKRLIEKYKTVDGKPLGEKNPKWLQDDYVKFLAFGQWRIERTGRGVLGFITNHGYLDNPTFRGMRQSLMSTFTDIYILNLHGNTKKKEVGPDGSKDENVFDIQQGVAVCLMVKEADKDQSCRIHYSDIWGLRESKYKQLTEDDLATSEWSELLPSSPYYLFVKRDEAELEEYMRGWKVTDIFPINSVGIVTARDNLTIKWTKEEIIKTVDDFVSLAPEQARQQYDLGNDTRDWKVELAQKDLKDSSLIHDRIAPISYRPFDARYTYYTGRSRGFHCMPRGEVMHHMLTGQNLGLLMTRQTRDQWNALATNFIVGHKSLTAYDITSLFPLYLYPAEGEMQFDDGKRRPNLNPEFITDFSQKLGLSFVEDDKGDFETTFGPEDIFNYVYAVFHSPTYRTRYAEFLKSDFPRLSLTSNKELFKALVSKGAELVSLHLMKSPKLNNYITRYPVAGSNSLEKVYYDENNQRVYLNKEQYFEGVPAEVWVFHIGGYQVCQKWLKDRKGRNLSYDDITHYQKIIVALKETIRLMAEIDEIIPGWPLE